MLLPIFIIMMVLAPVIVPAIITAVHLLTGQARNSTQEGVAVNFPRRATAPRLAAAAA
jgi:ABC-type spermidine/putrescine transport system permease subunit II